MSILDTIDNAIGDHETSLDAMRWTTEAPVRTGASESPSGRLVVTVGCTVWFVDRDGREVPLPIRGYNVYGSGGGDEHQLIAFLECVHFFDTPMAGFDVAPRRRRRPHISRMHFRYAKRRR